LTYKELKKEAENDPLWDTENFVFGNDDGKSEINIAGNSFSSSIFEMLPAHLQAAPKSAYIGKEEISVRKIDSIIVNYYRPEQRLFLKIDTQGYEKNVLEGATSSLDKIE